MLNTKIDNSSSVNFCKTNDNGGFDKKITNNLKSYTMGFFCYDDLRVISKSHNKKIFKAALPHIEPQRRAEVSKFFKAANALPYNDYFLREGGRGNPYFFHAIIKELEKNPPNSKDELISSFNNIFKNLTGHSFSDAPSYVEPKSPSGFPVSGMHGPCSATPSNEAGFSQGGGRRPGCHIF